MLAARLQRPCVTSPDRLWIESKGNHDNEPGQCSVLVMHPYFMEMMVWEKRQELDRTTRSKYLRRESRQGSSDDDAVLLRLSHVGDAAALARLAQLEGRAIPLRRHVVAELRGDLVAAVPLGPGSALADPFEETAHLIPLLELRARQLAHARPRPHKRAPWSMARPAARRSA
jgi:hypothetical protein